MTKENTFYKGNGKKIMKKKQREGKNGPITFHLFPMVIGVRAGGARGAAAPPKFWATQIFWAARENLGKASF